METNLPACRRQAKRSALAIILAPFFALLLTALAAQAQPAPVAADPDAAVTAAEVNAFMQSVQKDPKAVLGIPSNPKRVPLLLAAIKRDPAGPWTGFLQGFCYQEGRAAARKLPPANRPAVSVQAIGYLSTASTTLSNALQADPQNRQVKSNLAMIERALAMARVESLVRTNAMGNIARPGPASNAIVRVNPSSADGAANRDPGARICASQLTQIDLAKQMWMADNNKPGNAAPTAADLTVYLPGHKFPECPDGGNYVIGKLSESPRCSVAGHALPKKAK